MKMILKETLKPLYTYYKNTNKRTYYKFIDNLKKNPRFTKLNIKVFNYHLEIVDWLSFVEQFKEIFVEEIYKFKVAEPAPVILDCGANIGLSVVYFKELYPLARIVAFEPDPLVFKVLETNVSKNNLNQVQLINKAVWKNEEPLEFSSEGADGGSLYGINNRIKVKAIRLKEILEKEERVDLLKIDIEGAETEVLNDCRQSLDRVNKIFVEYHSLKNSPQELQHILNILSENNFRYHFHSIAERNTPFIDHGDDLLMDVQMNIFAHR